jgi:hypothetical protein
VSTSSRWWSSLDGRGPSLDPARWSVSTSSRWWSSLDRRLSITRVRGDAGTRRKRRPVAPNGPHPLGGTSGHEKGVTGGNAGLLRSQPPQGVTAERAQRRERASPSVQGYGGGGAPAGGGSVSDRCRTAGRRTQPSPLQLHAGRLPSGASTAKSTPSSLVRKGGRQPRFFYRIGVARGITGMPSRRRRN